MGYFRPPEGREISHVFAAVLVTFDNSKKRGSAVAGQGDGGSKGENRYERGVRDSAFTATELRTLNAASVPR